MAGNWPDVSEYSDSSPRIIAGRYRLLNSLGEGALGEVFRAEDTKFNPPRIVALKILHTDLTGTEEMLEQVRHEAGVMAGFASNNILRVIDFDISPGLAYIVTEYAAGGSLKQKIHPNPDGQPYPLPLPEAAKLLEQIAKALDEAHAAGLIHRDIKPANILLDKDGRPLLADFSLAMRVKTGKLEEAETWGTAEYAAPEIWRGRAGKSSDIYALGAVLYEMVTGYPPFTGDKESLERQHAFDPVPSVARYLPADSTTEAIDLAIGAAMRKKAVNRPRSADRLARHFSSAIRGRGDKMALRTDTTVISPKTSRRSSGRVPPWVLTTVVTLTIMGGVVINLVNSQSKSSLKIVPTPTRTIAQPTPVTAIPLVTGYTTLHNSPGTIWRVAWSPDGSKIAATIFEQTGNVSELKIWNKDGGELRTITASVTILAWSPDSKTIATDFDHGRVRLWDANNGQPLQTFETLSSTLTDIAWSPDGTKLLISSQSGQPTIWKSDGTLLQTLVSTKQSGVVRRVAWSPDGQLVAATGEDKYLRVWELEGGPTHSYYATIVTDYSSLAWSPDGSLLAAISQGNLQLVDRKWDFIKQPASLSASSLAWFPDNKRLAIGGYDSSLTVYRLDDKQVALPVVALGKHTANVRTVAVSPDGTVVVSGEDDGKVKLWKNF